MAVPAPTQIEFEEASNSQKKTTIERAPMRLCPVVIGPKSSKLVNISSKNSRCVF